MPLELTPEICRAVLEAVPIGVYLVDRQCQIAYWNHAAEKITGYLAQEVIGRFCQDNLLAYCDEESRELHGATCPLAPTMHEGRKREARILLRHKEGQRVPVRVQAIPIRDESGAIVGSAECFEERPFGIDAHRRSDAPELTLDRQTQVADRQAVSAALKSALTEFAAAGTPFGILLIAIDNVEHLKRVDGCLAMNAVLHASAQTLSANLRPEDLVGRWQDERFLAVVMCPSADALTSCAERLQRLVGLAGIPWWGDRLSVTVSVGGAMVRAGDTEESLTTRAAAALETGGAENRGALLVA